MTAESMISSETIDQGSDTGGKTGTSQQGSEFKKIVGLLEANAPEAANVARKWLLKLFNAGELPQELAEQVQEMLQQVTETEGIAEKQAVISSQLLGVGTLFKEVGQLLGLSSSNQQQKVSEVKEETKEEEREPLIIVRNGPGKTCKEVEQAIANAITILAERQGDRTIRLSVRRDKSGAHVILNQGKPLLRIDKRTGEIYVYELGAKSGAVAGFLGTFSKVRRQPEIVFAKGEPEAREVVYQGLKAQGIQPHHVLDQDPQTGRRDPYNVFEATASQQEELEQQKRVGKTKRR